MKSSEPFKSTQAVENTPEPPVAETADTRAFFRIAVAGTSLGLGCLAGTMEALKGKPTGISFEFSVRTLVAFAAGIVLGLVYWVLVNRSRTAGRWASVLLAVAGLAAFLYPLRFVPADGRMDLVKGFVPVVVALAIFIGLFRAMKRFFDADDRDAASPRERLEKPHANE